MRQDATTRPRGAADGAATGGQNASDQRFTTQMSVDSWNAGKRASRGQRHHAGSGHAQRFGVKPTGGAVADIWIGRPEVTPTARLRGVHADYFEGQARHGAEWRLLQDATEHAAGLTTAPSRHAILIRATKLAKAGSPVADKVREALIG